MTYSIVNTPFTKRFDEMSLAEMKDYNAWFHAVLPDRIDELSSYIWETGLVDWRPNKTADSLLPLGSWLHDRVTIRQLSEEEKARERSQGLAKFGLPEWELSYETISLAFDVGAYFGEVLVNNIPGATWVQTLSGNKKSNIYGQSTVRGANGRQANPIQLTLVLCYGMARGTKTGERLLELFAIWSKELTITREPRG